MLRGSILLVALLLAVAGCGKDEKQAGTQATTAGETATSPTTTAPPPPPPTTTAPPEQQETRAYQTWFTRDGQLAPVWQEGQQIVGVLTEALVLLIDGPPGDAETAIPAGTKLVNIGLADGTAEITLTKQFARADELAIAQVVYTATQFGTIRAVRIVVRRARTRSPSTAARTSPTCCRRSSSRPRPGSSR